MPIISPTAISPHRIGGKSWSSYWATLYDAMTIKPSSAFSAAANTFISTLEYYGIWAKLDRLFVFAVHTNDNGEALLDWKNPTRHADIVNSPAFNAYRGFTGGTNESINTNFIPSTDGVNYKQDDAMYGFYSRTEGVESGSIYQMGSRDVTPGINNIINIQANTDTVTGGINSQAYSISGTRNRGLGVYAIGRSSPSVMYAYENGEQRNSYNTNSIGLSSKSVRMLCATYNDTPLYFSAKELSMGFFSSCLSIQEFQIFTDAFEIFMKHNGFGVIPSTRLVVLGDSISTTSTDKWLYKAPYNSYVKNSYAVGGHSIMSNMDAQIISAKAENAQIYILALGRNDNNAGDMNALQAKVEENIAELKSARPSASIYYMNVLPSWTDELGGTEVDLSNIRTAIAAACLAQGITCWDTYSTPWITASDTSDGTHPNDAGCTKIWNEISSRL